MENNALTAGVSPDGLKNRTMIRVLICFIICNFAEFFTKDELLKIICERKLANYFEVCDALSSLQENGSVDIDKENAQFLPNDNTRLIATTLGNDLPRTVRDKSLDAAKKLISRRRSERENTVEIEPLENGCRVNCTIMNAGDQLMSVSLYVPDRKYAELVRERFLDAPEYLYRIVFAQLTGTEEIAPESHPEE